MTKAVVVASINAPDGVHCVDVHRHADGTFGYVLCRRDPEDGFGWRPVSAEAQSGFASETAARAAAAARFAWAVAS